MVDLGFSRNVKRAVSSVRDHQWGRSGKKLRAGRGKRRRPRRTYCVETLEPRTLLASVGIGFTGGSGPGFVPPDTMGAVGPNDIVEIINGRYAVYDKSGNLETSMSLDQFWTSAGVSPSGFSFDPRILYDNATGHWFAASVDNPAQANTFLVAVSKDSDPDDGWVGFQIDSDSNDSHWADFPMLGMNSDIVTLTANMFPIGSGSVTTTILVLPKSDLVAPTPTVANRTLMENLDAADTGFTPQPTVNLDDDGMPMPLLSAFNKPGGVLKTSSIGGTPTAPVLNTTDGMITVPARNAPPDIDQPGPKANIDAGDTRFGSNVVVRKIPGRTNPSLWAVEGVDIDGRAAIEWYEIDSVTNELLQNGTISDASMAYNYPSIAVNEFGDVAIGFSGGDPSTFMSTYVALGTTSNGVTTFDPVIQTHAGVADYQNLDGIGRNRWGDYSATVIDPTDPTIMWTFQEFASGVDQWSIRVTQLIFSPPTQVHGHVWQDENRNGRREPDEEGVPNWTVYLDENNNGSLDPGEASAVTAADGTYVLETSQAPGSYTIAQVLQPKWEQTYPAGGTNVINIGNRGEIITDVDFGNYPDRGSVSGVKWNDLDADGIQDPNEPGIEGVYIYADLDNNGSIALGEPAAITAADGSYFIEGVRPGHITIREVASPGWHLTYPASGFHVVMVRPDETTTGVNFGNTASIDFGDAPAPYPTLSADGGASHGILPGFMLGTLIDGEPDGIPNADATGDDFNNLDDEDGVQFAKPLFAGKTGTAQVTVSTGAYQAGVLQAWIDFNGDGDWNDPGEQVAKDLVLDDGVHDITFSVPSDAAVGTTVARFRYSFERELGPTGPARAGEVEDHTVLVLKDEPVAKPDYFAVEQDSTNNSLDVLANDFPSSTGLLTIVGVSQPARGQASIAPDGKSIIFTPNAGIFSPPDEVFTYTVGDGTGKTDSATVTVHVNPKLIKPLAVDDSFQVTAGSSGNVLRVLTNDLPGVAGTMQLLSVTNPGSGTAVINDNGTPTDPLDDYIVYTPDASFDTVDEFQYTIGNANGNSTATVTVFQTPAPGDQGVDISIDVTDERGNPINEIEVGSEFTLVVSVQDTRGVVGDAGVYAAYLDVLFDRNLVSPNFDANNPAGFDIDYAPDYLNGKSGDVDTPGLLNEVGAFQTSSKPLGDNKLEVFQVTFTARAVGTVEFAGNPADVTPRHDVLFYEPPTAVALPDIHYGFRTLDVVARKAAGESSNRDPMDVNADGKVTPLDALMIINALNAHVQSRGPGVAGSRLDVNRDAVISPIDALLVVNYLSFGGGGEGEAPAALSAAAPDINAPLVVSATSATQPADLLAAPLVTQDAALEELTTSPSSELGTVPRGSAPTGEVAVPELYQPAPQQKHATPEHSRHDRTDTSWDSLLNDLAEDVLEAWLDGEDA